MTFSIRRLTPADAPLYQPVRLEGLREHPAAFGASYDTERVLARELVAERLSEGATWGAFIDGALAGITSFIVREGAKTRHKGLIVGVYVRPAARGTGAARALIEAALDHARGRVELVQIGVGVDNEAARRLYERYGFVAYGVEPRAYKLPDRYVDDMLMWREV